MWRSNSYSNSNSNSTSSSSDEGQNQIKRTISTSDIITSVVDKQGPYVASLIEYFSHSATARFGLELLYNQPTFFCSDQQLLEQLEDRMNWIKVGTGCFGNVYHCMWLGCEVAVKILNMHNRKSRYSFDFDDPETKAPETTEFAIVKEEEKDDSDLYQGIQSLFEEYDILHRVRHPNIVGFYIASPHMCVTEYMKNGSLSSRMTNTERPPHQTLRKWSLQVTKAIKYLHYNNIVHSDISCDNVLLDEFDNVKLADLGAAYMDHEKIKPKYKVVTDRYIPLHHMLLTGVASEEKVGFETDKYALSIFCICLIAWNTDVFSVLGIDFVDREVNEAVDDEALKAVVQHSLEVATVRVWDILQQTNEWSNRCKTALFTWFCSDSSRYCNKRTLDFIQGKVADTVQSFDDMNE